MLVSTYWKHLTDNSAHGRHAEQRSRVGPAVLTETRKFLYNTRQAEQSSEKTKSSETNYRQEASSEHIKPHIFQNNLE